MKEQWGRGGSLRVVKSRRFIGGEEGDAYHVAETGIQESLLLSCKFATQLLSTSFKVCFGAFCCDASGWNMHVYVVTVLVKAVVETFAFVL